MSGRFGRNKRRRARETIEALSRHVDDQAVAIRMDRVLLSRRGDQLEGLRERVRDWDQRIRAMLGPYTSASIEDTTFRCDRPDQIVQMPVFPRPVDLSAMGPEVADEAVAYYVENVLHLVWSMREPDRFRMSREMSFDILLHGDYPIGGARYGMSESEFNALRRIGEDGVAILARRLAPKIARLLLADPKKARGAA